MPQSYSNPGGSGDRTASITIANNFGVSSGTSAALIDGITTNFPFFVGGNPDNTGSYWELDLGALGAQKISKFKWYTDDGRTFGNFDWEGWNGSSWVTLNSITLGAAASDLGGGTWVAEHIVDGSVAYSKFRLIGTGGTYVNSYNKEIEFEISDLAPAVSLSADLTDDAQLSATPEIVSTAALSAAFSDGDSLSASLVLTAKPPPIQTVVIVIT